MEKKYILGIDIGTTSTKAAVFDYAGKRIASISAEYSLQTPRPGFVEVPCETYMESIRQCLSLLRQEKGVELEAVSDIGFSVQGETLCFLDEAGEPLGPAIVWMDNRAVPQAEAMRREFGDDLCYQVTGQVSFESCWPAPKILWVKENQPDRFQKTRKILLLEDYVIYRLTGKFVAEGSLLTSTLYWDIRTKKYWPEMLAFLGIGEDLLPEIREPGEYVGKLLPEAAAYLGLPADANVCTGCLDQAAGAVGVGNIRPGIFSENIGAALAVCVPTERLVYDPKRQMPVHYFAVPDTYMMHSFTTGGMCLRWFRDVFCQEERSVEAGTGLDAYYLMDREAEKTPPGADGLITLPHLQGSMAPDMNAAAKAVFYGATLQHKKGHFIRSVMESLGYIIRRNLEAIQSMGLEIQEIRTLGGGAKSHIWNQIKADITGKTLYLMEASQDTACLGAAILAGTAGGIFSSMEEACQSMVHVQRKYEPNPAYRDLYQRQYEKYRQLFESLTDLFDRDARDREEEQ